MCGIVAYIGNRKAEPIVIEGLKRLEYRGYDSTGISSFDKGKEKTVKVAGKVIDLENKMSPSDANIALGHTRWATHGIPNEANAHPHYSNSKELVLIHNGIIENYLDIKQELIKRGYVFYSDTDTEVLVNLIEDIQKTRNLKLSKAVQIALTQVIGAYSIVVFDKKNPVQLIAARLGGPLAIGVGKDEYFIGSDATPFIDYTKDVIYLAENNLAVINKNMKLSIRKIKDGVEITPYIEKLKLNLENIQKGGYDYFMLKEIFEQPQAIRDTLRGRLLLNEKMIKISSLVNHSDKFIQAKRIIIVACGTSWHAGLVAEYLFENLTRIPVEVEYASEFRYRNPVIYPDDIVVVISQSGETADTMAAIQIAKKNGAFIYGVCNVVGSSISRNTDTGCYTHAGPEIGVASTKAFTTQVAVLLMLALEIGKLKQTIEQKKYTTLLAELDSIPNLVKDVLKQNEDIEIIAKQFYQASNMIYLGRGYNFPVALEGALKLKEISYIHAEGYPAAEMKHGPIALIDENMPVVVIATKKGYYEKVVSNIQEIKSRKGRIISIVTEGDTQVKSLSEFSISIPEVSEELTPILSTIPLQLLSYHIALLRGCNVDQPRNLAKSVTVE